MLYTTPYIAQSKQETITLQVQFKSETIQLIPPKTEGRLNSDIDIRFDEG